MKIKKIGIIELCNLKNPNFGMFASFLDGLGQGDEIEVKDEYVLLDGQIPRDMPVS